MRPPPSAARVRPVADADLPAVARLMGELGYPASAEQVRDRLARVAGDDDYAAYVAEVDGEVAGFLGMARGWAYEHERPYARIITLVVDTQVRRRGVGARLVEFADEWARERGAYVLMLNTNVRREEAHLFYESMGFRRTGYRYARAYDE
ncbi:MAG TPA: GNAT family N-acetyltransferase [Longimicrobium sp.]|nr:GNAT family N-acetyltransferase [Longimicrobium sp.]